MMQTPVEYAAEMLLSFPKFHKPRRIHLAVLDESLKPIIPYHWQNHHLFGAIFPFADIDKAHAWAVTAMQAGYVPYYSERKYGSYYSVTEAYEAVNGPVRKANAVALADTF
jgi:hypothetical protein